MKYKAFMGTDRLWNIIDQDNGQVLLSSIPTEGLATAICAELCNVYEKGCKEGLDGK